MKKKGALAGAGLLAASVIFAKILGAVYRIPLANIIGAKGMGIYQFVYPLFALLLTLSCGALPTAVSIKVSGLLANGDAGGAKSFFSIILKISVIIGLIGMILLAALAYPLSKLQSPDALVGYLAIAPAVLIVSVISALRGWFMGNSNLAPNSISQITEGIVKLGAGLTMAVLFLKFGVKYAAAGALLGVVASELVTLIIMFFIYLRQEKAFVKVNLRENKQELKELWKLAVPLIICGLILPLSQFVDSILIVNLLRWGNQANPTETFGVWAGAVTPLINLPVMVCITLGIAITPQMVEGKVKHDIVTIKERCSTSTKLTFALGVPFVFLFIFLSDGIVGALFGRLGASLVTLGADLLKYSAISVLGLALFQIYSAMLQGLDKPMVPVKIMSVCALLKIVISIIFVPTIGIMGGVIGSTIAYTLSGMAVMLYFHSYAGRMPELLKSASLIIASGVIMGITVMMAGAFSQGIVSVVAVSAVGMIIYFIALFIMRVFNKKELAGMPMGKYLVRLDEKLHGETEKENKVKAEKQNEQRIS